MPDFLTGVTLTTTFASATRVTMFDINAAPALVWQAQTADIPATVYTLSSGQVPASAKGAIVGVEVGYSVNPGFKSAVQGNIQGVLPNGSTSYPYTDIIRVGQLFDPAAAVGANMGQAWVAFPSSAQQIRYRLISNTSTSADKHIIIQLHGYWE